MSLPKRSRVEGNTVPPRVPERPHTIADAVAASGRIPTEARKTLFALAERHREAVRRARAKAKQS